MHSGFSVPAPIQPSLTTLEVILEALDYDLLVRFVSNLKPYAPELKHLSLLGEGIFPEVSILSRTFSFF